MTLEDAIARALGEPVRMAAGGSGNVTHRIETSRGPMFVKSDVSPPPGVFAAEAAGLEAMRASGTSLFIPKVIASSDGIDGGPGFLITELIQPGRRSPDFAEALGRGLAELHASTAPQFGFDRNNYCGATPQPNPWTDRWTTFYAQHRIGHQVNLACRRGLFGRVERRVFDRVVDRVLERLDDDQRPSLVHGDLWSGNLMVTAEGRPALIDPAVYFGHPEAELGMMTLFGGFGDAVFAAYEQARPLVGWRDRNPVYQLYHVLNHANLFGGGYVSQALSLARRLL